MTRPEYLALVKKVINFHPYYVKHASFPELLKAVGFWLCLSDREHPRREELDKETRRRYQQLEQLGCTDP